MLTRKAIGLARPGSYIFTTLAGRRMSHRATDTMLKRRAAKAGIEKLAECD